MHYATRKSHLTFYLMHSQSWEPNPGFPERTVFFFLKELFQGYAASEDRSTWMVIYSKQLGWLPKDTDKGRNIFLCYIETSKLNKD